MYSICMQFSKKLMHHCLEVYKYMQTNQFLMIRTRKGQYTVPSRINSSDDSKALTAFFLHLICRFSQSSKNLRDVNIHVHAVITLGSCSYKSQNLYCSSVQFVAFHTLYVGHKNGGIYTIRTLSWEQLSSLFIYLIINTASFS